MKTKLMTFKVTPAEKERFTKAAELHGTTVSEACRATLERIARKVEKQTGGAVALADWKDQTEELK